MQIPMPSIVALDIETTGLDPRTEAIIEIGAVRFNNHRIEAEYSTLINPHRPIPEFITNLTTISNEMVRDQPAVEDVLNDVKSFIGNAPILGHNIRFDLSFFAKFHLFDLNERIDTYEMAAVLLPTASRYNLGSLAEQLGVPLLNEKTHRAPSDARLTQRIYERLSALAEELPLEILAEIVRDSEQLDRNSEKEEDTWAGTWAFQQVLQARVQQAPQAKTVRGEQKVGPLFPPAEEGKHRGPVVQVPEELLPIDIDLAASALEPGGSFSTYFASFEYRPEQVEMLRAVADALSLGQHLLVEAGTGVGKSLAYLVPAAEFALHNNTRVVISTNTINLQDQLIHKDIPDLCAALHFDLRAAVLKGRANYLCPRRLELMRRRGPTSSDELRVLAKVLVWQMQGGSGDRTGINMTGPAEREVWLHLSAEDDGCTSEVCLERQGGGCPFYLAKQAAQAAHLLVVNHALLLTDVAVGNRVLPDYQHVIIDEGHHLEDATTGALSFRLTQMDLERLIREIGNSNSGVLGQLLAAAKDQARPSDFALLTQRVERATDLAWRLQEQAHGFFEALSNFIDQQREGQGESIYVQQERLLPSSRTLPGWDDVEISWSTGGNTLKQLLTLIGELQKGTADLYSAGVEALEDSLGNLGSLYRRLAEAESMVDALVFEPTSDSVYWVESNPNTKRLALNVAPVHVGPLVEKYLWHEKRSVILTSATLTANHDFSYIRESLSADEADELALGSPFDYQSSALLYIPSDIQEPHQPNYQQQVEETLTALCKASGGRTMVLFTSYAQLKRTAKAIKRRLESLEESERITVFEQGEGSSPNSLLDAFKSTARAVLLGTRSFWEGVDVPGEALSVLVIVKLPFDVPTDPLVAARSDTFEDAFNEYQLPEAILRFRQGFGRLIRSASDKGVVVLLDRRVLSKSYGKMFIDSLPNCTRRVGTLAELPRAAARWLG
jgi:DNA polymerase-3 subunit epsilon/ATP-dependent DNA helicase DinG